MEDDEEVAELRIASVRGLLMMLQAIKPASKQVTFPTSVSKTQRRAGTTPPIQFMEWAGMQP